MVIDDLIIGSGLTALGVAWGLPVGRRVLVIAGTESADIERYDALSGIPCANRGAGGLGAYWHGVIPMRAPMTMSTDDARVFGELFSWFYPRSRARHFGTTHLFVPTMPIRPVAQWPRLQSRHPLLSMRNGLVQAITRRATDWEVRLAGGADVVHATRVWLAAGALGSAAIIARSAGLAGAVRPRISDHVIAYLGQIDRRRHPEWPAPRVERDPEGIWLEYRSEPAGAGVVTCKPARFDYRRLDHGIEQRAAFGLPTAGVLGKLIKAGSPGLIAESLFNKFGLFPTASRLSVYAQLRVHDAYERIGEGAGLRPVPSVIESTLRDFRSRLDWPELTPSRRPELYVRGIHLHRTVDTSHVSSDGLAVVDAAGLDVIGPEHHSFAVMAQAARRARESA